MPKLVKIFITLAFSIFISTTSISVYASVENEAVLNTKISNVVASTDKKDYSASETVNLDLEKSRTLTQTGRRIIETINIFNKEEDYNINVSLKDSEGNEVDQKSFNLRSSINDLEYNNLSKPGEYTIYIEDPATGTVVTQNFTWGVLAINTPKSIYSTNEDVQFQIGVLDDQGEMVCDAKVDLVVSKDGNIYKSMSTETGEIKINDVCNSKEFTLTADYEAHFTFTEQGDYSLQLTAETPEGVHSITDSIKVDNTVSVDFERISTTRIFPKINYPVILKLTPDQDFSGTISDYVPSDYVVSYIPPQELEALFGVDYEINKGVEVINFPEDIDNKKRLSWEVNYKAGETYYLAYQYDAPDVSPEFDLIGKAEVKNSNNEIVFTENRFWQVAVDDTAGPNSPGTTSQTSTGNTAWAGTFGVSSADTQDDIVTSCSGSGNYVCEDILATNYGFSIPLSATVDGIIVEIDKHYTSDGNDTARDFSVQIIKGGTQTGTDQSAGATLATSDTDTYNSYGGASNLWGTTWTATDINASNFGVSYAAETIKNAGPDSNVVNVDHIQITVYYTPSTISVSGNCKQINQTTNCSDSQTVRVAVNGSLQAQTTTTSGGTFTISSVNGPNSGDSITTFLDGVADANEAVSVTAYDGTGNITNVDLFEETLTIGSDDNATVDNTDLAAYDNSVSADEDIFHDFNTTTLTVDSTAQSTQEKLYINPSNTYQPASGGGNTVSTHDLQIAGTLTADSNTINLTGSWDNDATFTAGTSTVNFNAASGTETIDSTGASTASFNNLTLDDSVGTATFQLSSALDVNGNLTITGGTLDANTNNITIAGNWDNDDTFTASTGSVTFDATSGTKTIDADGTGTDAFNDVIFNDGGGTATFQLTTIADINGSLTITGGNFDANSNNITVAGNWTNNDTFTSGTQTTTFDATSGTISIDGTGTGTSSFSTLTLNDAAGTATFQLTSALDVNGAFNITDGIFSMNGANNINTAGAVTIGSGASYTKGTGSWTHDGTYTLTDSSSGGPQNLGTTVIDGATNTVTLGSNVLMDSIQVATGDTFAMSTYDATVGATGTANSGGVNIIGTISQTSGTMTIISSAAGTATMQGSGTLSIANLTIGNGATTFTVDNETNDLAIDLSGNFTITAAATFSASSTAAFNVAGSWSDSGTFTPNSSTVTLDATTGTPTILSSGSSFNNLTLNDGGGTATFNLSDALDVNNNLTITGGTLDTGTNFQINVGGTFTNNDTFTANSGTVVMDGTAGSIAGTTNTSFYNLTIDPTSAGTITLSSSDPTVTNTLSVATGDILSLSASRVLTMGTSSTVSLSGTVSGAGRIDYVSSNSFPSGGTYSADVRFDGTNGNHNIVARTYGGNVEIYSNSGAASRTFTLGTGATQTINISGNLNIIADNTQNVVLSGATHNPTVNITGNLDFTGVGAGSESITTGTGTWTVSGNVDLTGGTLTATAGNTFQMNGSGATITSASQTFQNFAITGNSVSNTDSMDVNGTFDVSGGATFTHGAGANIDINIAGDFTLASGTTWTENVTSTSQVIFDGDLAYADNNVTKQSIGNVVIGLSPDTTNLTTDFSANSLTVTSADVFNSCEYDLDIANSDITVDGTLDLSATGTNVTCASTGGNEGDETTINLASSFTVSGTGTVVHDQSTLIMDNPSGTDTIALDGESLYNLTVSPSGITQFADTIDIDNNLSITTGTLDLNSQTVTIGGNFDNDAAMTDGTATVTFNATSGTKTIDADGTGTEAFYNVIFNDGGGTATYQLTTLMDVDNDFTITGGTFDANGQNMNIGGSYSNSDTFTSNSNTITFDDVDGGETLSGTMTGSSSFYALVFNDGATAGAWSFGANSATVTNNFTITGGTVTAPSTTLTIAGNFTNNDTFTHNSGTIVFNDSGQTSTLAYSAATTFNNFTVNTASKALQFDETDQTNIAGTLTLQGGSCATNITLDSAVNDDQFAINATGTVDIDYVDVEDSNAIVALTADNSTETNGGNTNWTVNAGLCVPVDVNFQGGSQLFNGAQLKPAL